MKYNSKKIITRGLAVLGLLLVIIFLVIDTGDDLAYLTKQHTQLYPDSFTVENVGRRTTKVEYVYTVNNTQYSNKQTIYGLYKWINGFYDASEQYAVIYLIDDPNKSKILGDLYLDFIINVSLVILASGSLILVLYFTFRKKIAEPAQRNDAIRKIE